ncbi:neuroblastoma-amplified sequence isoform X2 [Sigmodon hispidus]
MCMILKAIRLHVTTSWRAQGIVGEKDVNAHSWFSYFLKVDDSICDQELLALLVDAKLLVKCVSTPFYPHIVGHLVATKQQGLWDAEELARHLQEAGHEAEAGSLLLAVHGTHRAFRTFSTALSAVRQWM